MMPSVGMPFSGGQDSIMNLILQVEKEGTPIHLFYFRMHTATSQKEEALVKEMVPKLKNLLNAPDIRLNIVDAFNLEGLSREPNPFLPFRNYFFGQYLMGLGFKRILFSFSAEDSLFYDTSEGFLSELAQCGQKNMGHPVVAFTHTGNMGRIEYMKTICDKTGFLGDLYHLFRKSHSCSSPTPCRACLCCLLREIAEMWAEEHYRSETEWNCPGIKKKRANFIQHWQGHTTFRDFYRRIIAGDFRDGITRDQYWAWVENFEKGALLKGLVL